MRIKAFFGKISISFGLVAAMASMAAEFWSIERAGFYDYLHPKLYSFMLYFGMATKNSEPVLQPKDLSSFTDADLIQTLLAVAIVFASWGLILAFISRFRKEHSLFYSCSLILCVASAFYISNVVGIILTVSLAVYVLVLESLIGKYV